MTTPKTPRGKQEPESTSSPLAHADGCPADRIDSFTITDPKGTPVRVTRCLDCGSANYERE